MVIVVTVIVYKITNPSSYLQRKIYEERAFAYRKHRYSSRQYIFMDSENIVQNSDGALYSRGVLFILLCGVWRPIVAGA